MEFAGAATNVDTDPGHLARLAAVRSKPNAQGVYTFRTWPSMITFDLGHPRAEDVRLIDIVHSLAMQSRYAGHVPRHYSVAQHSILVAEVAEHLGLPRAFRAYALLHDAHEAYNQDVIRPAKKFIGRVYENLSADLQSVIHRALGMRPIPYQHAVTIKTADDAVTALEQAARRRGDMLIDGREPFIFQPARPFEEAREMFRGACLEFVSREGTLPTVWENFDQ